MPTQSDITLGAPQGVHRLMGSRAERLAMGSSRDPSARLPDRTAERMADTMFALSTPNRLQILVCLRAGPLTVSEIVHAVGMEQSAVSHQLRVLREHSVVSMRRAGRTRQYALRDERIAALIDDALEHIRALDRPREDVAGELPHSSSRSAAS